MDTVWVISSDIKAGLAPGLQHASNEPWPGSLISCLWEGVHVTMLHSPHINPWSALDGAERTVQPDVAATEMDSRDAWCSLTHASSSPRFLSACWPVVLGFRLEHFSVSLWNQTIWRNWMCVVTFIYGCVWSMKIPISIKKSIDSSFSSNLSSLSMYKNLGKMTADALWLNIRWQKIFNNVLWSVKKIVKKLRIFKRLPKSHVNYFIYKKNLTSLFTFKHLHLKLTPRNVIYSWNSKSWIFCFWSLTLKWTRIFFGFESLLAKLEINYDSKCSISHTKYFFRPTVFN